MGRSVFIVFLLTTVCILSSQMKSMQITHGSMSLSMGRPPTTPSAPTTPSPIPTPSPTPSPTLTPSPTPTSEVWMYIGISIGVAVLLVAQSICFCIYMKKLKSSQSSRKIENMAILPANRNSEDRDRYQRAPSHHSRINATTLKPEYHHSSSLYEYEVVRDIGRGGATRTEEKPEPPPTSTLPKRNRPRLPLPRDTDGSKSLTLQSSQHILQQRGQLVSTMPSKLAIHNAPVSMPSRSPQSRRLPIVVPPVQAPVQKPRDLMRSKKSYKIYESLPDLRRPTQLPKPPPPPNPPMVRVTPPRVTPDLNMARRILLNNQQGRETPSPILPSKPRYLSKPKETMMNESRFSIYESLPDLRQNHQVHPTLAKPSPEIAASKPNVSSVPRTRRVPEPESFQYELLQKFKRRADLSAKDIQNSRAPPNVPKKPPVPPPSKDIPKTEDWDDSSDNEWTLEELKQINMYNI